MGALGFLPVLPNRHLIIKEIDVRRKTPHNLSGSRVVTIKQPVRVVGVLTP